METRFNHYERIMHAFMSEVNDKDSRYDWLELCVIDSRLALYNIYLVIWHETCHMLGGGLQKQSEFLSQ